MSSQPAPQAANNPPRLSFGDYLRFSQLLLDRCGLFFSDKRQAELEMGIRQAFAASTCASLEEYYQLLQRPDNGAVKLDQLINAVTVSETHFFRDASQFDALYRHVLPEIIERRRPLRTLRIWSAGCASGEEAYSIAILLRELLPDVDEWAITILGTDINTQAIDRARKALYGEWAFREEQAKLLRPRYFRPHGNRYELVPEVRRMVTFSKLNLAEPCYPALETNTSLMDMISCRNVSIYFEPSVTNQMVNRFYDALVDGGWLMVGHSELSLITYRRFQARNFPGTVLYQRTGEPTLLPDNWLSITQREKVVPITIFSPPVVEPVQSKADESLIVSEIVQSKGKEQDPLEQAQELLDYGHSEEARDMLLERLKSKPTNAPACALLGQAYANLGQWSEAEHWCRRAIFLDKLCLNAYYTLSLVLQHEGKLEQAIKAMKNVVYIDRNYVLGHFSLANLYHSQGQLSQANKSLNNAYRLLAAQTDEEMLLGSNGVTVGRLRQAIVHAQQQWMAEDET